MNIHSTPCLRVLCVVASVVGSSRAAEPATSEPAQSTQAITVERFGEEASHVLAQAYEYDATIPLEARIVEKVKKDDLWREKVVFRGAQGLLVPGYLQLTPNGTAPYACVLLLHGWSGSKDHWWQDGNYISGGNARRALLAAGFAVLALDA